MDDLEEKFNDVGPNIEDLVENAKDEAGAIDVAKFQSLEGRYAHVHGNKRCDVLYGPCACGAYHEVNDTELINSIFRTK